MKSIKLIALSALFAGALFAVEGLSIDTSVAYQSEQLYRGLSVGGDNVSASVEASYKLYNGSAYASTEYTKMFSDWSSGFVTSVGYKLPVYGNYTVDAGVSYYNWFTDTKTGVPSDSREFYAGVSYAGLYVNPALYASYDFDLEAWTLDLSGSYSYDLAQYGVANTTLDLGAHVAYTDGNDVDSLFQSFSKDGYFYAGANADVAYHLTDASSVALGATYAMNNDRNTFGEKALFWGVKFSAGF